MSDKITKLFPPKTLDVHEQNLAEFFKTMHTRQQIWYKRFVKEKKQPWSKDKILNEYKICNVYRELDRTSQYLINNVILDKTNQKSSLNMIWKIMVFRLFNNTQFFDKVTIPFVDDYNSQDFYEQVESFESKYGSSTNKKAYAINSWLAKGTTQGLACAKYILPSIHKQIGNIHFHAFLGGMSKPQNLIKEMTRCEGIGMFVSHEFYIDFCYLNKYTSLDFMFNEDDWSNVGPGASGGIRVTLPNAKVNMETLELLRDLSKEVLPDNFKYIRWNKESSEYERCDWNISVHQIEFWLCEYFKYWKIKNGVGKSRDKFRLSKRA